jgi:hypothetical protein
MAWQAWLGDVWQRESGRGAAGGAVLGLALRGWSGSGTAMRGWAGEARLVRAGQCASRHGVDSGIAQR